MCLPPRDGDMGERDRQIPRSAQVGLVCMVEFRTVELQLVAVTKYLRKVTQ